MIWLIPSKETAISQDHWAWFMEHYTTRMHKALFAEAVRLMGSREDAQDIMQEAMVRGASRCWQLRDEEKLFQWMVTIVRNLCFDAKKQRFRAKMCAMQLATGAVRTSVSLEERTITAEFEAELRTLLEQLPSPEKEIVQMKATTNKSLKEIADELGLNYHTTRSKYNRTIKKITKATR